MNAQRKVHGLVCKYHAVFFKLYLKILKLHYIINVIMRTYNLNFSEMVTNDILYENAWSNMLRLLIRGTIDILM